MSFRISVIVPCYNEEKVIDETVSRLVRALEIITNDYEIIFINDGSRDGTLEKIETHCAVNKKLKCISFSRNFGHQPAISAGIFYASGEVAVIIDADLQDPPEVIPRMIEIWQNENCNVVYAVREKRVQESFFKKITAKIYYRLINKLSDVHLPLDTGDFRLIDRKVMDEFNKLPEKQKYIRGLISWIGFKQVPVFYERHERFAGTTSFSAGKMLQFARTGLISFTRRPLRIATNLGVLCFFVGIVLIIYVLVSKYYFPETTLRGWSSLLIVIIFFGGTQLLSVGLLGEYIASIFDEVKSRPEFIADRLINL
jgi:glycosyltransferase involved in cell wall biosynthesis